VVIFGVKDGFEIRTNHAVKRDSRKLSYRHIVLVISEFDRLLNAEVHRQKDP